MKALKIFLWGTAIMHIQILLSLPIFLFLPKGGYWDGLAFLLFLILFVLNVGGSYLISVFYIFRREDIFSEGVGLIAVSALLCAIFVPLSMKNFASYQYYKQAKPQTVLLDTSAVAKAGNFLKIDKAQILGVYTQQQKVLHRGKSRPGKSDGVFYFDLNYKICPIVPENWRKGQPITFFLAYNSGNKIIESDFQHIYIHTLQTQIIPKYGYHYAQIAQDIVAKHSLQMAGKPVFLEMVDIPKHQAIGWWYFCLFYGLMTGIWALLCLLALAAFRSKSI